MAREELTVTADERTAPVVVGLGARTSIGLNAPQSAAARRAGIMRFAEHPFCVDRMGEPMIVAAASYLDVDLKPLERCLELLLPTLAETLAPVALSRQEKVPLILGLPSPRPWLPRESPQQVADRIARHGCLPVSLDPIETIPTGHASGVIALGRAASLLRDGRSELCVVAGADSFIDGPTLEWLDEEERLKSAANPWGFTPGEAAGACLLASPSAARQLGLACLARLRGIATAYEEGQIGTDSVCVGVGLTRAASAAMEGLPGKGPVDTLVCDLNGERYRTDEYGFMLARLSHHLSPCVRPSVPMGATRDCTVTPASCWGDIGAASALLFVDIVAAAGLRGYATGNRAFACAGSDGGERGAFVLELPGGAPRKGD